MIKHSINISPISTLTKKETSKTKSPPQASSAGNTLGLIEITAPRMHLESGHETLEASIAREGQRLCRQVTKKQAALFYLCSFQHQ